VKRKITAAALPNPNAMMVSVFSIDPLNWKKNSNGTRNNIRNCERKGSKAARVSCQAGSDILLTDATVFPNVLLPPGCFLCLLDEQ
jgi:hypothetical protein